MAKKCYACCSSFLSQGATMNLQSAVPKAGNLVIVGLWLCLAYILSVGPAFYVARETGIGRHLVHRVYAPLFWVHDNTALDTPLKWYSEMWEAGFAGKDRSAAVARPFARSRVSASQQ
jgi:hypothetical protein